MCDCGACNREQANFCRMCGNPLPVSSAELSPAQRQQLVGVFSDTLLRLSLSPGVEIVPAEPGANGGVAWTRLDDGYAIISFLDPCDPIGVHGTEIRPLRFGGCAVKSTTGPRAWKWTRQFALASLVAHF